MLAISSILVPVITAVGCGQLAQKERELTFRVESGTASWYSGLPHGVVEANLPVTAGDQTQHIHTWWWPAQRKDAPAVLYLHGARWNLIGHVFRIQQLHDFGFSVLAVDYRGFGQSDGDYPSEKTVYEDARVAWDHLAQLQPDAGKRFIYGHSLGGAVAVDLAAHLSESPSEPRAGGLIVESSFSSLSDIARALAPSWLPVKLLMSQKFDSVDKIHPACRFAGIDCARFRRPLHPFAPVRKIVCVCAGPQEAVGGGRCLTQQLHARWGR
jgi:pimeloyl-ACP methyl ester carboxylesterase